MKKTSMLTTHHWQTWVTNTINLSNHILISLSTICHNPSNSFLTPHSPTWRSSSFFKRAFELRRLQIACHNTQYSTPYVLAIIHITRKGGPILETFNIINHYPWIFHISPTYTGLTRSTPLPGRSTYILKTNTLSSDCPVHLLSLTYLKHRWSLSAMILFVVPIPQRTKRFKPNTKLRQFGETRELNISMTTSNDEPPRVMFIAIWWRFYKVL